MVQAKEEMRTCCVILAWGFLAAGTASADIVVQQLPVQIGGPGADTLFRDTWGDIVWQQVADNISLSAPATVRKVSWWGFYGGSGTPVTPPPASETMRIRFYGARAGDGLPDDGNILLEESHTDMLRTATGAMINVEGGPAEHRFQVDLRQPVQLFANTLYWMEIVQIGDIDSTYRWENGYGTINGQAYINSYGPYWRSGVGSFAFELSTVPETQSVGFFLTIVWTCLPRSKQIRQTPL